MVVTLTLLFEERIVMVLYNNYLSGFVIVVERKFVQRISRASVTIDMDFQSKKLPSLLILLITASQIGFSIIDSISRLW